MGYNPLDTPNVGDDHGFRDWADNMVKSEVHEPDFAGDVYHNSAIAVYDDNGDLQFYAGPAGVAIAKDLELDGSLIQTSAIQKFMAPMKFVFSGTISSNDSRWVKYWSYRSGVMSKTSNTQPPASQKAGEWLNYSMELPVHDIAVKNVLKDLYGSNDSITSGFVRGRYSTTITVADGSIDKGSMFESSTSSNAYRPGFEEFGSWPNGKNYGLYIFSSTFNPTLRPDISSGGPVLYSGYKSLNANNKSQAYAVFEGGIDSGFVMSDMKFHFDLSSFPGQTASDDVYIPGPSSMDFSIDWKYELYILGFSNVNSTSGQVQDTTDYGYVTYNEDGTTTKMYLCDPSTPAQTSITQTPTPSTGGSDGTIY